MHRSGKRPAPTWRTVSVFLTVLLVLVVIGVGANRYGEGIAFGARTDTEFKVSVTAAQVDDVNQVSSGSVDEPIIVTLRDSYATGPQEWSVKVSSIGPDVGALNIRISDPDPNNKIKEHLSPVSVDNTNPMNNQFFPDLFTQLRFEVWDGDQKIWNDKLGTDGEIQLTDPSKNNPAAPGYLKLRVPVRSQPGGQSEKTLKMVSYVDSTLDKDSLAAYNGTTTGVSIRIKGETR